MDFNKVGPQNMAYYDYFDYKGVRYPVGTAVILNEPYNSRLNQRYNKETVILKHKIDDNGEYYYVFDGYNLNRDIIRYSFAVSSDKLIKEIVENPSILINSNNPRYEKDSENDDVKFGWLFYIMIMIGLTIFKDAWVGWIATTVYFFVWRRKQLRK